MCSFNIVYYNDALAENCFNVDLPILWVLYARLVKWRLSYPKESRSEIEPTMAQSFIIKVQAQSTTENIWLGILNVIMGH